MAPASVNAQKRSGWSRFNVEPGEQRSAALMLSHSAFMGFATVFFETAASALFLAEHDASALATVYLAAAGLAAATGFVYSKLQTRVSFATLMMGTLVSLTLIISGLRGALFLTKATGLFFFAMVFYRVLSILTDLEYWAVAGRLYDLRQAKRLFGFIGTGEVVARIAGAFSVPFLLRLGGVTNLLVLSAIALLVCVVLLHRILPLIPRDESEGPQQSQAQKAARSSLGSLVRDPYLRFVIVVAFCGILGKYLVDFAFLQQVKGRYSSAQDVASFFALFSGVSQCASLFTRVFLSGRVLSVFGVHRGLLVLPGAHLICTTLLLVAGGLALGPDPVFWLVVLNQGIYKTLKHPIDGPSIKTLYQPIPKDRRLSLSIAVDVILSPVGIALSSGAMVLFTTVFRSDPVRFAWVLLICFGFWLWSAQSAAAQYIRALEGALRGQIEDIEFAFDDVQAVRQLQTALRSGSPEDALVALQILGDHTPATLSPMLVELVSHKSEKVRRAALERTEAHHPEGIAPTLRGRLEAEQDDGLRSLVLRAISAVEGKGSRQILLRYADSRVLALREAAVLGLRRIDAPEADEGLRQLAGSPSPDERSAAARLIRANAKSADLPVVTALIADPDPGVSRLAMMAASQMREPALLALLIERVTRAGVAGAARAALAAVGPTAVAPIARAFERERRGVGRRALLSAVSQIKSPETTRFLVSKLDIEDIGVRQEVTRALARLRFVAPTMEDRARIDDLTEKAALRAAETLCQVRDLEEVEGTAMLRRALLGSHRNTRERLLMLLGFTRDTDALQAVRKHIDSRRKDDRAYAREILDVVLTREERSRFLPVIEGDLRQVSGASAAALGLSQLSPTKRLESLFLDASPAIEIWVRTAAFEAAPRMKAPGLADAISTFLKTPVGEGFARTGEWSLGAIRGVIRAKGIEPMLLIEKVITLKAVDMFARTPEDVLADVAGLAEEIRFAAGDSIFKKGDSGDSLYVIVTGDVRVHDGEVDLKRLQDKSVFGELAVLDPEPRSASVTAVSATHVLRLGREAFLELMASNTEVVRGVLSVLCDRIRNQAVDVPTRLDLPAQA